MTQPAVTITSDHSIGSPLGAWHALISQLLQLLHGIPSQRDRCLIRPYIISIKVTRETSETQASQQNEGAQS